MAMSYIVPANKRAHYVSTVSGRQQ